MLHQKKDSFNTGCSESDKHQVELQFDASKLMLEDITNQPIEDEEMQHEEAPSQHDSIDVRRQHMQIKPQQRYAYVDLVAFALTMAESFEEEEPSTYHTAIISKESAKLIVAMTEEIESLYWNQTWELVKSLKGKRIISCKWIFKRKEGIPGIEDAKYKACLVAKGYSQKKGVDFNDIFSPVVKHTSIRVLLAIVTLYDLELK